MLELLDIPGPVECRIVERLNRFVVLVKAGGREWRASTNNTGRLHQFLTPGRRAFCLKNDPRHKTDFRLFAIEDDSAAAVIDTQLQMRAFERCVEMQALPWLKGYGLQKRNVRLGDSLIDYLLAGDGGSLYLEVKSAVLREGSWAMYPDCPTARGRRHVQELTRLAQAGGKAIITFIAALPAITAFKPFREGDPEMFTLLAEARSAGVDLRAIGMAYDPGSSAIHLSSPSFPVVMC